ncbi:MAG TPA: hypothetical protein VGR30_10170 [Candidatus Binatia bacterium]|nr:hypothetical protein [Candidatus Binatia bacterium]
MSIRVRNGNGINPPLPTEGDGPFRLVHRPSESMAQAETHISHDGTSLMSSTTLDEGHALNSVLADLSTSELPSDARRELKGVFAHLHRLNRWVFDLALQELRLYDERYLTSGPQQWSRDGTTWYDLPHEIHITGVEGYPVYKVDAEWVVHLQQLVHAGERPFLAAQHLHEARRHRGTRFRWIEATTAAELAIKEALLRMEPKFAPLLLEVPSPPLGRLYGSVLEAVAGERSPFLKALQKGVEVRNRLVHRPSEPDPDPQQLADYVGDVDRAVRHLRRLCRRRNPDIRMEQLHRIVQWDHSGAP